MSQEPPPEEEELSSEDLAILHAFDAMEEWDIAPSEPSVSLGVPSEQRNSGSEVPDDVLLVFFSEIQEGIEALRQALRQAEQGGGRAPSHLLALRRTAHKIRGSAGMMSYEHLATIAHSAERIVEHITSGKIPPLPGINALIQTVLALETTLNEIMRTGAESDTARRKLEAHLQKLAPGLQEPPPLSVDVELHRLTQLTQHTEPLVALRARVEYAQAQIQTALQELHAVQLRWQHLETELPSPLPLRPQPRYDAYPTSSRIARLLQVTAQQNERFHPRKMRLRIRLIRPLAEALQERPHTEINKFMRSLSKAKADLTIASTYAHAAFTQLQSALHEYMVQVDTIRNEIVLLHPPTTRL